MMKTAMEVKEMLKGATKENVFAKAMNTERDKKFLWNVPHINICDLSVSFFVTNRDGHALLLNRALMRQLCTDDVKSLCKFAEENVSMTIKPIESALADDGVEDVQSSGDLWVVRTPSHEDSGAGALAYPHFFEKVTEKVGDSFWILPSSKCELLVLVDNGAYREDELFDLVKSMNLTQVVQRDFLSDNVYHWDGHVLRDHFGREETIA